jgi:tetratricopeptide (TPR) repeat protein
VQTLVAPNATLKVIARASASVASARALAPAQAAQVLHADFLLGGTIAGEGDTLRIHADLRGDGRLLWQHELTASVAELHSSSGEAARRLAEAVGDAMLDRHLCLARLTPLPNLQAHALLFGGVALMHRFSRRDFQRARELLTALHERAPRHSLPSAWLARWHLFAVIQGWSSDAAVDRRQAQDLARRALDADPDSSLAMAIAGSVHLQLAHDIVRAEALYRQALAVNPQESLAWLLLGTALGFQSRGDEAVRHSEMALSLSPIDPMRYFYDVHGSATALAAGRYERAIELAKRALKANRLHTSTYRSLAIAQSLAGRLEEARGTVEQLLLHEPGYSVQTFLERSAGSKFGQGERFARALRDAGLPEAG